MDRELEMYKFQLAIAALCILGLGVGIILYYYGWPMLVSVLLLQWANNINNSIRRLK